MFDRSLPPPASKGTVPMTTSAAGKKAQQARPKGRIAGKDQPRQPYRDLLLLPDGRVLVGYRGRYITSPFGLQVRGGNDLAVLNELPDAAGPFSLRGGGLLLASGPLTEGYESTIRKVDLPRLAVLDMLPVRRPYLWLPGRPERLVGQTPKFLAFRERPHVDPALLDRHPQLRRWAEDRTTRLLLVGPDGGVSQALDAAAVGPEYPEFKHLALSPDGATLYAATESSVAAVSLGDWSIQWRAQLGDNDGPRFFSAYAMALSPDGRLLAIGGLAGYDNREHTPVLLDAATGEAAPTAKGLGRVLGGTSIRSLAWHPSGWLAVGTASGRVAHLDLSGAVRSYKGAGQGIESLLFMDQGRSLLVCGAEKQFRVWPLLEDELAPG
jgi:WD40 repeat protein